MFIQFLPILTPVVPVSFIAPASAVVVPFASAASTIAFTAIASAAAAVTE
ncbi:hypothetical protein [Rossellomorea marisflavi]